MNEREAVHVLAVCSSYDGRKPSTVDAQTWAYELKAVDRDTAVAAVRHFYRTNPDGRIRPGHVTEYVAEQRKPGLARSSRIENAVIEALDPDDPDYDAKYLAALQGARHRAAETPEVVPERIAVGGRVPDLDEWAARARRGGAVVRQAITEANKPYSVEKSTAELSEKERKLQTALIEYRAQQRGRDNGMKLGRVGGQVLQQINPDRKATSS